MYTLCIFKNRPFYLYNKFLINYSYMSLAIEMSLPGSNVYVFTDADAKDQHLANQVVN